MAIKATGSDISKKIERYAQLNAERKALEKEEEALKEWFREESKGKDVTFSNDRHDVLVTKDSRTSVDLVKLRLKLGEAQIKKYEKTTSFLKVSVRDSAKEKTA